MCFDVIEKIVVERNESDWRTYREMSKELRMICLDAVTSCADMPPDARKNIDAVGSVEISTFDQSYIEFLGRQIPCGVLISIGASTTTVAGLYPLSSAEA